MLFSQSQETTILRQKADEQKSPYIDFYYLLINAGVPVSIPEWTTFLAIANTAFSGKSLTDIVATGSALDTLYNIAKVTLVKDIIYYHIFDETFDQFFRGIMPPPPQVEETEEEMEYDEEYDETAEEENEEDDEEPEQKEKLDVDDLAAEIPQDGEESGNKHGGNKDQHNDILRRASDKKEGGGDRKEVAQEETSVASQSQTKIMANATGSGGSSLISINSQPTIAPPEVKLPFNFPTVNEVPVDPRQRYEVYPDAQILQVLIQRLRAMVTEKTQSYARDLDISSTVQNLSKKSFDIEYTHKAEEEPEIVLLIDIGGSTDKWIPMMVKLAKEMTQGLTKLSLYLFHNNIYGYVWPVDLENILQNNIAAPNSILDVKQIINDSTMVIIYGDAQMAENELETDNYAPSDNDRLLERYTMPGTDCLELIRRRAKKTVWINPILRKDWYEHTSGTLEKIEDIVDMYDLSWGGIEDALTTLME